jgi:hypothetical protein
MRLYKINLWDYVTQSTNGNTSPLFRGFVLVYTFEVPSRRILARKPDVMPKTRL